MGATTIWERWNSVLPSGLVSDTGMNSMNHYAYGAIVEWMYRYMCGLNPVAGAPGFAKARVAPMPDERLDWAKAAYRSASGLYESGWSKTEGGYAFRVTVPFGGQAEFVPPGAPASLTVDGKSAAIGPVALGPGAHAIAAQYPDGLRYGVYTRV
jgi:alpha-L-rhamnosidase